MGKVWGLRSLTGVRSVKNSPPREEVRSLKERERDRAPKTVMPAVTADLFLVQKGGQHGPVVSMLDL